jgi:uncharacterized membrane protein
MVALGLCALPDGQTRGELAQFVGGFHPLAVHLPIALLLVIPLLEIAGRTPQRSSLQAAAGFVLGLAALSAIVTPYLGWLLAWSGGFEGGFVTQHFWGGTVVAAGALLCWMLRGRLRAQGTSAIYAGFLAATLLAVAFTGNPGGQHAHGEDHQFEHKPVAGKLRLGLTADPATVAAEQPATFYAQRIAPILEQHCVLCHGANKRKGKLRVDSYEAIFKGGEHGAVVKAGSAQESELLRRVNLDPGDEEFMPGEGKPPLGEDERTLLALWIEAGASSTVGVNAIAGAPALQAPVEPWAPDYRTDQATLLELEAALRIRLVPRSQIPTDGLILRTANDPAAFDDSGLENLLPIATYIVDAELARTAVTDAGLVTLAQFKNLRRVDLSHTRISSSGVKTLATLSDLQVVNLTGTAVDDTGVAALYENESLQQLYLNQTNASPEPDRRESR